MTVQDFERECNFWLSISQHRNTAHAFAFGKWEGCPAILVDWYPQSMAELKADECSDDYIIELVRGLVTALNFAYCGRDISKAEQDAGLPPGALLFPNTNEAQRLIVRSLDDMITGGKYGWLV
jgi:hypothetical protein